MKQLLSLIWLLVLTGCASIPKDDIAFMDHRIKIGLPEEKALPKVEARGFREVSITPATKATFNYETEKFDIEPAPFKTTVERSLGFSKLVGEPRGNLRCFQRRVRRFLATGARIMCWTAEEGGVITWRQAGWWGASL